MMRNISMMRLKQHLMTIIRLISLVPMLGDKVPFRFSLNAVVGFATQLPAPVYDKVKRATLHPVRRVR
ncbi:MAG: hypothetical protein RMX26_08535 [Planktomarina sp.]|nr:hypothetical protein [Planktomarina sp.]